MRPVELFSRALAGDGARAGVGHDSLQGAQKREARRAKFGAMRQRHPAKNLLGAPGESQQNLPSILLTARSPQKAVCFQPVHEFDGAVMLDLQALGEKTHGGIRRSGQPFEGKQGLILLRLNSCGARGLFA